MHTTKKPSLATTVTLAVAALGVVYGDIGTSPLYAIKEIFFGHHEMALSHENILGVTSIVIWALTIIVAIKYVAFVLRADNDGEGGVFALFALLKHIKGRYVAIMGTLLILAAGLLFGDGIITPAISVISAVEGLNVVTTSFEKLVVPITLVILTGLFFVQKYGTAKIGKVFGPIMLVWFAALAYLGGTQLAHHLEILAAVNPVHAIQFIMHHQLHALFLTLGSVMLVVTGGEAMYADMGHFGRKPIRMSWFAITYPALLLNYLGQGAFLLSGSPVISGSIFFSMVPGWALLPMIILATLATIIASQALITGAFSLATQAISLGLIPFLRTVHTHHEHEGQIYVPFVNWALFIGCIMLVLTFKTSSNLASAYGLAVSGVMLVTTLSMIAIAKHVWKWSWFASIGLFLPLSLIDATFLIANSLKILQGGYVPLLIGLGVLAVMKTWQWGRSHVKNTYSNVNSMSVDELIATKKKHDVILPRSVVIMTPNVVNEVTDRVPFLKQIFWERYGALPKHLIFLTVTIQKEPHVQGDRYNIHTLYSSPKKGSVTGVEIKFGFMEEINVEAVLQELAAHHLLKIDENPESWLFHVAHERVYMDDVKSLIKNLQFNFFQLMLKNSDSADQYFGLGNNHKLTIETIPVHVKS